MISEISIQKVKISSNSKTFDMTAPRLPLIVDSCYLTSWLPVKNISVRFKRDHFVEGIFGIGNVVIVMTSGMSPLLKHTIILLTVSRIDAAMVDLLSFCVI